MCEIEHCDKKPYKCKCACLYRNRFCKEHFQQIMSKEEKKTIVVNKNRYNTLKRKLSKMQKELIEITKLLDE